MINTIRWEINSLCNLRCKHCFLGQDRSIEKQSYEEQHNALIALINQGLKKIIISSKEPLLEEHLAKHIKYCRENRVEVILITNGILFSDKQIAEKIVLSGVNAIYISSEGIDKDENDYIRGQGTFEKIKAALYHLNDAIMANSMPVHIGMQTSLYRFSQNTDRIKKFLFTVNELPIDSLSIGRIIPVGNALNQDICISNKEFDYMCKTILRIYEKMNKKNFLLSIKGLSYWRRLEIENSSKVSLYNEIPQCSIVKGVYSLMPNGEVIPCVSLNSADWEQLHCQPKEVSRIDSVFRKKIILNIMLKNQKEHCKECLFVDQCIPCLLNINDYQNCYNDREKFYSSIKKKSKLNKQYKFTLFKNTVQYNLNTIVVNKYSDDGNNKRIVLRREKNYDEIFEAINRSNNINEFFEILNTDKQKAKGILEYLFCMGIVRIIKI